MPSLLSCLTESSGSLAACLSIMSISFINLFPLKQNFVFSHLVTKVICWEKNFFILFTASKWVLNCSPSFFFFKEQGGRHSDM